MIRKFLTVTSFLMISTVCLNVNAMITEEQQKEQDEIIEQQFKVYVEIKNKQIDDYFSLFQGESEDFVPKKFTDKQVELLVAGKDGNGAEITINNKKIIIDKKTSEELYTYAPSSLQTWNPMRRLLHDRINFGIEKEKSQDEKIKLVQQGSFGVPHIIEVTYTLVPKAFSNDLGSMTLRIEEQNWEKNELRNFIAALFVLLPLDEDGNNLQQIKVLVKLLKSVSIQDGAGLAKSYLPTEEAIKNDEQKMVALKFIDGLLNSKENHEKEEIKNITVEEKIPEAPINNLKLDVIKNDNRSKLLEDIRSGKGLNKASEQYDYKNATNQALIDILRDSEVKNDIEEAKKEITRRYKNNDFSSNLNLNGLQPSHQVFLKGLASLADSDDEDTIEDN
jgi:hypothetical protein